MDEDYLSLEVEAALTQCAICDRHYEDVEDYVHTFNVCDFCKLNVCNTCNTESNVYISYECHSCLRVICGNCMRKRNCFHHDMCCFCRQERHDMRKNE